MISASEAIVSLLSKSDHGLDIMNIVQTLKLDIRDAQNELIALQKAHKIMSGLKKFEGSPAFFDRVYYKSPTSK